MNKCKIDVSVHRYHDLVAISMTGGKTVYLDWSDAMFLAGAINQCGRDIQKVKDFGKSQFSTWSAECEGKLAT